MVSTWKIHKRQRRCCSGLARVIYRLRKCIIPLALRAPSWKWECQRTGRIIISINGAGGDFAHLGRRRLQFILCSSSFCFISCGNSSSPRTPLSLEVARLMSMDFQYAPCRVCLLLAFLLLFRHVELSRFQFLNRAPCAAAPRRQQQESIGKNSDAWNSLQCVSVSLPHAGSGGNQLQLEFAIIVAALPCETRAVPSCKKDNQLIAQAARAHGKLLPDVWIISSGARGSCFEGKQVKYLVR